MPSHPIIHQTYTTQAYPDSVSDNITTISCALPNKQDKIVTSNQAKTTLIIHIIVISTTYTCYIIVTDITRNYNIILITQ